MSGSGAPERHRRRRRHQARCVPRLPARSQACSGGCEHAGWLAGAPGSGVGRGAWQGSHALATRHDRMTLHRSSRVYSPCGAQPRSRQPEHGRPCAGPCKESTAPIANGILIARRACCSGPAAMGAPAGLLQVRPLRASARLPSLPQHCVDRQQPWSSPARPCGPAIVPGSTAAAA